MGASLDGHSICAGISNPTDMLVGCAILMSWSDRRLWRRVGSERAVCSQHQKDAQPSKARDLIGNKDVHEEVKIRYLQDEYHSAKEILIEIWFDLGYHPWWICSLYEAMDYTNDIYGNTKARKGQMASLYACINLYMHVVKKQKNYICISCCRLRSPQITLSIWKGALFWNYLVGQFAISVWKLIRPCSLICKKI